MQTCAGKKSRVRAWRQVAIDDGDVAKFDLNVAHLGLRVVLIAAMAEATGGGRGFHTICWELLSVARGSQRVSPNLYGSGTAPAHDVVAILTAGHANSTAHV